MLLLLAAPVPAAEDEADPQMSDMRQFTCPVGGVRFTQEVGFYVLPLVSFPDGSFLGDDKIDAEIPLCPDNGLVILPDFEAMQAPGADAMIYGDYSAAELARLPGLIADPAYRALAPEGRHAQAFWLATRLGRPALLRFILLQRATWAATDPALRRRLVARLVEEGPTLIDAAALPDLSRRAHLYYIVNALRELGRFDEALAFMETVEREGGPPVQSPHDPDTTYGTVDYAPLMRAVIAEKDMERFPVRLMTWRWARMVCGGEVMPPPYGPLSAASKAACARREDLRARGNAEELSALEELDPALEEEEKEQEALRRDPAALGRACAATPEAQRGKGLARACEWAADERDRTAGKALADDGPGLAAICEDTPEGQRTAALRHGCSLYDGAVGAALVGPLAEDDAAYAILCPDEGGSYLPDRVESVSDACDMANMRRIGKQVEAERKRIAADDGAFAQRCGRFRQQLSKPRNGDADEDSGLMYCRTLQAVREGSWSVAEEDPLQDISARTSLMTEARARAAAIIAKAKAEGAYPKRRPGEAP